MSPTPQSPTHDLRAALGAARRALLARSWRAGLAEAALIALAAFFVVLLVAADLDDGAWQAPLVLAPTLAGLLWLMLRSLLARRRWASDEDVAAALEEARPELRSDIRAALELSARPPASDASAAALREHLALRVATALDDPSERFGDLKAEKNGQVYLGLALALTALVVVATLAAPSRLVTGLDVLANGPLDEQEQAGSSIPEVMAVRNLNITATPPAYTQRALRHFSGTSGSVRVLEGSELRFEATLDRPVERAVLRYEDTDESEFTLNVSDGVHVSGTMTATESAAYSFEFEDPEGQRFRDGLRRELEVEEDRAPVITIEDPDGNLSVNPGDIIDIRYTVRDDFGISGVNLVWYFAGEDDDFRQLPLLGTLPAPSGEDTAPFDTAPLALQPGDEVIVQIEATDNDGLDGPNVGRSRPISLVVDSPEDLNEEVFAAKERAFEALLTQLANMLEVSLNEVVANDDGFELVPVQDSPEGFATRVEGVASAHEEWGEPLNVLRELVDIALEDELTSQREQTLLQGAYNRLYERERDEARLLGSMAHERDSGALSSSSFASLARFQDEHIAETERVVLVLESLIEEQQAEQVARAIEELDEIRARIGELFDEYQQTGDEQLRDQLLREINRLSQRMNELMERLQSQVENLPQEFYNQEALDPSETAENMQNLGSSLEQMRDLLNRGDMDGARRAFEEMSSALDMMQQELGDPLANADPDTLSEYDRQMGEIMDQVVDLEAREAELERQTGEFEEQLREERREEIAAQLERELERAREEVSQARERIDELDDDELTSFNQEQLQSARASLETLERQLEREDIFEALDAARRSISQLDRTQTTLDRARAYAPRGSEHERQAREGAEEVARDAQSIREVEQALQELQDAAQPRIGEGERQAMQQLAQRQQELQQDLDGLQESVRQFEQGFPMMSGEFDAEFEGASQGMGEARRQLQGGEPRPAQQGQRQAISSLRGLRQQLQQQMSSRREQQERRQGGRRNNAQEDVEVPDEADQRTGRREQIMEAMREGGLQSYEEQLEEYYERLVQ